MKCIKYLLVFVFAYLLSSFNAARYMDKTGFFDYMRWLEDEDDSRDLDWARYYNEQ